MYRLFKTISILILSLLVTTCDSGDGGGSGGSGGGSGGSGGSSGWTNNAANNATGADNEVICTVKVNSRSFDENAFVAAIASELGCSIDDITITGVTVADIAAYVSFIFISADENQLLEQIQSALSDGTVGDFEAMVVIANMDDDITCTLGEDCAGICGGEAVVDACGVCGGDTSSCDSDDIVGLYRLEKIRIYDSVNSDGSCSGSLMEQISGPDFGGSDSYSYDYGPCDYDEGSYDEELYIYMNFSSSGEWNLIHYEEELDDTYSECYGDSMYCDNGECEYCYEGSDIETFDFEVSFGNWSSNGSQIHAHENKWSEWEYSTNYYQRFYCGELDYVNSYSNNGCIETYDGYNYEGQTWNFDTSGNKLYLYETNDNYYYDYYDYYDVPVCIEWEFKESNWPSVGGCTDPFSVNYNPFATFEDGSCDEGECGYDYAREKEERKRRHPWSKD